MNFIQRGKHLKSIREKKGISLEEVYEKTRIQTSIIKEIEEGASSLPPVFLKGFIKTYAQFLKIDIEEDFKTNPPSSPQVSTPKETSSPKKKAKHSKKRRKKQILFVFLILISGFFISQQLFQTTKEGETLTDQPEESSKALEPTQSEKNLSLLDKIKGTSFHQDILIKSSEVLEIYFKVDDQKLKTKSLFPKEWYNIKAVHKIYLRFDKTEDVQVFYNGKKVLFKDSFFEKIFSSDTM